MKDPKRKMKDAGSGKTAAIKYRKLFNIHVQEVCFLPILLVGFFLIVGDPQWQDTTGDVRAFIYILFFLSTLACIGFPFCQIIRSKAYAMIQIDGIHIVSKDGGELTSIAWEDVQDCVFAHYRRFSAFLILVMRWDVSFRGKPIASYHGDPFPRWKEDKAYLLDRQMEKLARGKMTPEELHELPVIMLYLIHPKYNKQLKSWIFTDFDLYREMWSNRKFNGVMGPDEVSGDGST